MITTVPAYARPLEGEFGEGIRAGVRQALDHFLAEIAAGGAVPRPDVYRALGQGEMQSGRSLDSLLSAYRIGARVAWRRFSEVGVDAGLEPETLFELAESIFAYIDVLSAESAEGHAAAQLGRGRRARAAPSPAGADARARPAARCRERRPPRPPRRDWSLPRSLAVLAIAGDGA